MPTNSIRKSGNLFYTLFLIVMLSLVCAGYSYAITPSGYSEYYIPADENTMGAVLCAYTSAPCPANYHTHAGISITAWSDNTTIYYDHWENGYNFDPTNPSTADETFTLNKGQAIFLESANIVIPRTASTTCDNYHNGTLVQAGATNCYDGGDHIYAAGGVVTVTRVAWIEELGVGLQGVAWEIYPLKPQLTTYVVPFGETSGWYGFQRVSTLIQATQDNTVVTVDINHDGTPDPLYTQAGALIGNSVTLNKGQTFLLNDVGAGVAAGTLAPGAVITGTSTLQVKHIAGRTDVNTCTRGFSSFPRGLWTTDYYAPLNQPGNDLNGQASTTDYYLYNPNSYAITINWQSSTASGSFSIPATTIVSYVTASGTAVPTNSGLYFKGSDVFWGVGSNDSNHSNNTTGYAHEWGFSLLPSTLMFNDYYAGWAPDGLPVAAGQTEMGLFVVAAQDNTQVFVDYNNDGVAELTYTLNRLQTQYITNPSGDLSNAHVYATGPMSIAYGQNSATSGNSTPAMDLGYIAIPGTNFIDLVLGVQKSVSPSVVNTASGSQATFTITVNSALYTVNGVTVTDYLPAGWQYVNNSATITQPNYSQITGASANPTITGTGPYTLSWSSAQVGGNMLQNQQITITFIGQTTQAFAVGALSQNNVQAVGTRTVGGITQTFMATDFIYNTYSNNTVSLQIAKSSSVPAATPVNPGNTLTYTVTVTNPSSSTVPLTGVSIYDPLPTGVSYVSGTSQITGSNGYYLDTFSAQAYNNQNGTLNWGTNWIEDTDGGSATGGRIQVQTDVTPYALRFNFNGTTTGRAIARRASLSGYTGAILSFIYRRAGTIAGDAVAVQVCQTSANATPITCSDSGGWTTIATIGGAATDASYVSSYYNLASNFLSANFAVRLAFTGSGVAGNRNIYFDNIQVFGVGLATSAGGTPPDVVDSASAYFIAPGQTLTLTYNVTVNNPLASGIDQITNTASANSNEITFPLSASVTNIVVNPSSGSAQVGNFVWLDTDRDGVPDPGEPGIANVTVTLKDQYGTPVMTTTTDSAGYYLFTGVQPGNGYYVEVTSSTLPSGLTQTAPAGHTDNRTGTFNLTAGQSYMNANLGYAPSSGTATIGNYVWSDANSNGLRDPGEVGLAGVTVQLCYDANGNGILDPSEKIGCATTTTASDGSYLFTGVTAGRSYFVYIDETQASLSGYTRTVPSGSSTYYIQNVNAGDVDLWANFGYHSASTYTISDKVWFDANGNGSVDAGETGIPQVTVELLNATQSVMATTTTDSNGNFTFSGVPGGGADYTIRITDTGGKLANYFGTTASAISGTKQINNLTGNVANTSFGYNLKGTIGTTVFNDNGAGGGTAGDGIQNGSEPGIAGVVVKLYKDVNGDGIINVAAGAGTVAVTNGSATVTGTGTTFTNYHAGEPIVISGVLYNILSVNSATSLTLMTNYAGTTASGLAFSAPPAGAGTVAVTNGSAAVVGTGTTFTNYRAGEPITIAGVAYTILSVTDNTHLTLTSNYTGATASGRTYYGPGDALVATLTTDANGNYLFTGLADRHYIVSIESPPSGYTYTGTDSDSGTPGQQQAANISGGSNFLTANFGYRAAANRTVSGVIWNDANQNGIKDSGESGIAGVTVSLSQGSTVIATTTTDANGNYSFTGLPSGTYTVTVTDTNGVLNGYLATYQKTGGTAGNPPGEFSGQESVDLTSGNQTDVNFGYCQFIPTRVLVSEFVAYEENGQVVVQWKTASEENTIGFYLLRKDKETGRYRQINKNLLPGLINSHQGGTYSLVDSGASLSDGATYKLVEVESYGKRRTYGPFPVGADIKPYVLNKADTSAIQKADVLTTAEVSHYKREAHGISQAQENRIKAGKDAQKAAKALQASRIGDQAKISVTESDMYYLKASDIAAVLGMPELSVRNMIRQTALSLSNQGKKVAYVADNSSSGIYFYGQAIDSIYTGENIYWLNKGSGVEMVRVQGKGPLPVANGTFSDTLHFEENLIDAPGLFTDPNADYWFWDYVVAGDPDMGSKAFTLHVDGVAPGAGTASLLVNLRGGSDSGVKNEHHAVISLNGTKIGETLWQGTDTEQIVTLSFSQNLLKAGDNTVEVAGSLDAGVPYSIFYINSFDVTYQRLYQAVGNELLFRGDANQVVSVSGFTNANIMVFDVTDGLSPKWIEAVTIDGSAGNYRVSLKPASSGEVYIAISSDAAHAVGEIWADAPSSLKDKGNDADYMVITTSGLKNTAASLAAYRKGQGSSTMVVDLENIMDEFNYGIYTPVAIRDFLSYAYKNWKKAPKYVVLAGDGSYDYKNNLGFGDSVVPPMLVVTPDGLFPSDNYFVSVNRVPFMAIGRLPACTSQELQGMIDKTIAFEKAAGGGSGSRILMLADMDGGGLFTTESEQVASVLPATFTPIRIYLDQHPLDEARSLLFNGLNKGVGVMNYVGHGGLDRFSGSGLLVSDDVSSMTNVGKYPVVTAMTCIVGQFSIPGYSSLAEYLVLQQQGGAVAMWSPTGISIDSEALILDTKFFQHAFRENMRVLGDVIMKTLQDYSQEGSDPSMMDIYNLLGDPALKMGGH